MQTFRLRTRICIANTSPHQIYKGVGQFYRDKWKSMMLLRKKKKKLSLFFMKLTNFNTKQLHYRFNHQFNSSFPCALLHFTLRTKQRTNNRFVFCSYMQKLYIAITSNRFEFSVERLHEPVQMLQVKIQAFFSLYLANYQTTHLICFQAQSR